MAAGTQPAAREREATVPWTADEAFRRFEERTNLERGGSPHLRNYRLERMAVILERLGNPHEDILTVHIAGSKGKGSVAAYSAALLAASGYRTGLYTSPHITGYRERYGIVDPQEQRREVSPGEMARREAALAEESRAVWHVVETMSAAGVPEDQLPTTFELLTALAFRFFRAMECSWIVLETGLGGRLDATNLCRPAITLITRIELEHQEYLGTTLAAIAREKAGIIKEGVPVVMAPQHRDAAEVITAVARERHAPITVMGHYQHDCSTLSTIPLAMAGDVQYGNACHAWRGLQVLAAAHLVEPPRDAAVHQALSSTTLPGRGERIADLFLDGAHTPESVGHVMETALRITAGRPVVMILGIVEGKDYEGIAAQVAGRAAAVIVGRPGTFKGSNLPAVLRAVEKHAIPAHVEEDPLRALQAARDQRSTAGHPEDPIVVTGSFYMVAEIRRLVVPEGPCP